MMKYLSGEEVRVGDKVRMWEGCFGIVVCSIDTDEYSMEHPREQWSYLQTGVTFETDCIGLVHYTESDEDLELLERAPLP
jgi:hypothetical protein